MPRFCPEQRALLEAREAAFQERIEGLRARQAELPPTDHAARAEIAVVDHLLGERLRAKVSAVRLDPPTYVVNELGDRPSDPAERRTWDWGVTEIEGFRAEHGITDRKHALGRDLGEGWQWSGKSYGDKEQRSQLHREQTRDRLNLQREQLERAPQRGIEQDLGHDLSIGM